METDTTEMTETEFASLLSEAMYESEDFEGASVRSFEDVGLLTMNQGLVVRVGDSEFQLTIVRSR